MKLVPVLLLLGGLGLFFSLQELRAQGREAAGRATTYFPSGQVQTEVELADGVKHGVFRRYRADGTLETEGEYSEGRMDGEWRWYALDGSIEPRKSGVYSDGDRVADLR